MKNKNIHLFWLLTIIVFLFSPVLAKENGGKQKTDFYFSVNYPGAGIGFAYNLFSIEFKAQGFKNTQLAGLRVNRFLKIGRKNSRYGYFGIEASGFSYEDKDTSFKSNGTIIGTYVGLEQHFTRHFSLTFDVGPYYASSVKDNVSNDLFDFVANTSINYYFKGLSND